LSLSIIHCFVKKWRLVFGNEIFLHVWNVIFKFCNWFVCVVLNICSIRCLLRFSCVVRSILEICGDDGLIIEILAKRIPCCYKLGVEFDVVHCYFLPCVGSTFSNRETWSSLRSVNEICAWFSLI
jgi:hypothetical protein